MNVCVIPARGGSRRIPRKNLKLFHGEPIISYSIATAIASRLFNVIAVSTEDEEIADFARKSGVGVVARPAELAQDHVGTQEVMKHALDVIGPDEGMACCLYATAPMLTWTTLERASWLIRAGRSYYVVPVGTWLRDPGQFYMGTCAAFREGRPLLGSQTLMLPIDPATECDINTPEDWQRAERMYAVLNASAGAK